MLLSAIVFIIITISPVLALSAGFLIAYFEIPLDKAIIRKISRLLMGLAIVALGFGLQLSRIAFLTEEYLFVTISGIFLTLLAAWFLGPRIGLNINISSLIGAGTAICGASAIAALGSGIKAKPEEISISLAVVLMFNALALILFPLLGHLLELSPATFAAWAGLAIHDTSSVVGAALVYSADSVEIATTVKLARAIWIAPLVIVFCRLLAAPRQQQKLLSVIPWFIWGYLFAAMLASAWTIPAEIINALAISARKGFSLAIFLIGCATEFSSLKKVGLKPFLSGLLLWIFAAIWSLLLVS